MGIAQNVCWVILYLNFVLIYSLKTTEAQPAEILIANISTSWINFPDNSTLDNERTVRPILQRGILGCRFYSEGNSEGYLFAIFTNVDPRVVWSANPNNPVKLNSTLHLTAEGGLVLKDSDHTVTWSTNTTDKSVTGLYLTEEGISSFSTKAIEQSGSRLIILLIPWF